MPVPGQSRSKVGFKALQEKQIRFMEPEMFWMKFCMPCLVNQGFGRFLTSFAAHISTQGMEISSATLQTQHRETAPCLEMWTLQCGLVFLASFVSSQYDLCLYYSWRLSSLVHIMPSLHCDFFFSFNAFVVRSLKCYRTDAGHNLCLVFSQ